ncbi:MAG: hypothetical protein OEU54_12560, partial [Gemmatimonadota bacterium]|nr:hypothetical protein [Gemmatimonadota bacterium]
MPLKLVRSDSNAALWRACSSRFLDELGLHAGPDEYPSHLWLAHRTQRDLLLDAAEERDLKGWLAPPFSFLSELPALFGIDRRPIGLLTGRLLVSRLAAGAGREHGFVGATGSETPGRGHMVDRALSELLPEGVMPAELASALEELGGDDFTRRRNAWLLDTYAAYVEHLETTGQFDPRSIHSLVADAIDGGALPSALGGAGRLHVFGVTSLRGRTRLFRALAAQAGCEVIVYLPSDSIETDVDREGAVASDESGPRDEWEALAASVEDLASRGSRRAPKIQPVPDAVREAEWVATRIKRLIVDEGARPHEIAVIARSGRDDTRRVHDALRRTGVPSTARLRSRLHEVPALRAVLQLFSAASDEWSWTPLSAVLGSPYFGRSIDLRALDMLASRSRPRGLAEWLEGVDELRAEARSERGWILRRAGVSEELLDRTSTDLALFVEAARGLTDSRDEAEWISTTRGILRGERFGLRERV